MTRTVKTSDMLPDNSTDLVFHENEPSLTQQQFARECDINTIVTQYQKTGLLGHVNQLQPQFGDFTGDTDYQTALNLVNEAQSSFMALDASLRARFGNDPANLLAFVADPANYDEAVRLGLASPTIIPEPLTGEPSTNVEKPLVNPNPIV